MLLKEFGVSYSQLEPDKFVEITNRFTNVRWYRLPRESGLGHQDPIIKSNEGLLTYQISINWLQTERERRITLVHEAVHVHWEEGVDWDSFREVDLMTYLKVAGYMNNGDHEGLVDREARRFQTGNRDLVERVYMGFARKEIERGAYPPKKLTQ